MTAVAPMEDGVIDLSKGMMGELRQTYLSDTDKLYVREQAGFNEYTTANGSFIGFHTMIDIQTVKGEDIYVITLIPKERYSAMVFMDQTRIVIVSVLVFITALVLSLYLSRRFVRPISSAVNAIKTNGAIGGNLTGFSEIDSLVEVLDSKVASIKPSSLPSEVSSLLDEFSERFKQLTATERRIIKLYAEKKETSEVAEILVISIHTARKHNANIYRKLNVGSREELVLYLDLFRRCKKLDELFDEEDDTCSL